MEYTKEELDDILSLMESQQTEMVKFIDWLQKEAIKRGKNPSYDAMKDVYYSLKFSEIHSKLIDYDYRIERDESML